MAALPIKPALMSTAKGWAVVGVESRGRLDCTVGTIKTRVDAFLPFIDGVIAANR